MDSIDTKISADKAHEAQFPIAPSPGQLARGRFVVIHGRRVDFPEGDWLCIGAHVRAKLPGFESAGRCMYLDDANIGQGGISYESLAKPIADGDVIPWGSKIVTIPHASR